jgi:GNAT superfamily N-acetyltransferase
MLAEKEFFNAFVVKEEEKIVGFATYSTHTTWSVKNAFRLYAKESHRSQSLGSELMNKIIETAQQTVATVSCAFGWFQNGISPPLLTTKLGADVRTRKMNCELKINPS